MLRAESTALSAAAEHTTMSQRRTGERAVQTALARRTDPVRCTEPAARAEGSQRAEAVGFVTVQDCLVGVPVFLRQDHAWTLLYFLKLT